MNLKAEISLFFGRALPIICPFLTERMAVTSASELANGEGEAVNDIITAKWYRKGMDQFLPKQFRYL